MRRAFILDLAVGGRAADDLSAGGVFIPNASVEFDDECHIVLRAGGDEVAVIARVVQVLDGGAGFQIDGMTRELRERIAALLELAKHGAAARTTLTSSLAATEHNRRSAAGSIPPATRRGGRVALGSISPILAFAPTQQGGALVEKARAARAAAEIDDETDD